MQSLVKALTGVLVAGALAGTATPSVAVDVTGPPGSADPAQRAVAWRPCPQDATAECGTLRLPVDWARPTAGTFDLAVARRTATDPARRIGVLFVNPGGPGDSGVDFAVRRAPGHFSADVRARFDIVGFDPRGVGASQPIRCSAALLDQAPSGYPADRAEFDQLAAYNRALRQDCRRHSGPVFDHADTLSVVRDMDALRAALGEERINYFGHSYGTLIGEQYAEQYGERLRTMALTANMDHSLGLRAFLVSSAVTAEDSFQQFARWCATSRSCALYGRNVTAVWDGLLARADRGELSDPDHPERPLTARAITLTTFKQYLYGPAWGDLARYLAGLEAQQRQPQMRQSQERQQSRGWQPRERQRVRPLPARAAQGGVQGVQGAPEQTRAAPFSAVFCQDWRFRPKDFREYADLTAAELRAAPHLRGSPRVHAAVAGCVGWPDEVNNPQHRLRITRAPKILMLHSRHDPANHYAWAARVHRQTRGTTVLLPYEGAGHSVYGRSDCTRGAVDDYLLHRRTPAPGSSCAPVPQR